VNCRSWHIEWNYSTAYSGFNIRLNISALLLEIIGHVDARYTANLVPNTAHILLYTLCELWSRTYTMHLQHRIFSVQYSSQRICAAIVHITTIQCSLYCKLVAKYSAHPPVYAMWTVVPAIYKVHTAPHIKALIFNCRQLPCYWRYHDNSIACYTAFLVPNTAHILQATLCVLWSRPYTKYFQHRIFRLQYSAEGSYPAIVGISTIQWALYCKLSANYSALPLAFAMWTVVPLVYNVFTAPHIQSWIINWTYLRCCWWYADICMRVILQTWCEIQRTSSGLRYAYCGPGHIQRIYSSAYSGFNIRLNLSALLLEIIGHVDAHYTANLVPNTTHIVKFTLCERWSRTYTM
jgi:hypothetical protein